MNIPTDVYTLFEQLALEIRGRGFTKYSADAILHRIRWHMRIELGRREFKANNNWTPFLSRWLMEKDSTFSDFFETRVSEADQHKTLLAA